MDDGAYPSDGRYFEDITVGGPERLGSYEMTEAEIRAFAEQWDPLPIHTDPEHPATKARGGLIASGFHTLCATSSLRSEHATETAVVGGLGLEEVRWPTPVRPGDTIVATSEILDKRVSESRPSTGIVRSRVEGTVEGETVIEYVGAAMIERRTVAESQS